MISILREKIIINNKTYILFFLFLFNAQSFAERLRANSTNKAIPVGFTYFNEESPRCWLGRYDEVRYNESFEGCAQKCKAAEIIKSSCAGIAFKITYHVENSSTGTLGECVLKKIIPRSLGPETAPLYNCEKLTMPDGSRVTDFESSIYNTFFNTQHTQSYEDADKDGNKIEYHIDDFSPSYFSLVPYPRTIVDTPATATVAGVDTIRKFPVELPKEKLLVYSQYNVYNQYNPNKVELSNAVELGRIVGVEGGIFCKTETVTGITGFDLLPVGNKSTVRCFAYTSPVVANQIGKCYVKDFSKGKLSPGGDVTTSWTEHKDVSVDKLLCSIEGGSEVAAALVTVAVAGSTSVASTTTGTPKATTTTATTTTTTPNVTPVATTTTTATPKATTPTATTTTTTPAVTPAATTTTTVTPKATTTTATTTTTTQAITPVATTTTTVAPKATTTTPAITPVATTTTTVTPKATTTTATTTTSAPAVMPVATTTTTVTPKATTTTAMTTTTTPAVTPVATTTTTTAATTTPTVTQVATTTTVVPEVATTTTMPDVPVVTPVTVSTTTVVPEVMAITTMPASVSTPTVVPVPTPTTPTVEPVTTPSTVSQAVVPAYNYELVFPPKFDLVTGRAVLGVAGTRYERDPNYLDGSFCSSINPYPVISSDMKTVLPSKAFQRAMKFFKKTKTTDKINNHPQDLLITECFAACDQELECTYVLYSEKSMKCYMFKRIANDGVSLANAGCSPFVLSKTPAGATIKRVIKNKLISPNDQKQNPEGYKYYIKRDKKQ